MTLRTLQESSFLRKRLEDPRHRLKKLLNEPNSSRAASGMALLIVATIMASVINFFMSTVPRFEGSAAVWGVEVACGVIFSIELTSRTYVATLDIRNMMLLDAMYWVDVLTIIPFYIDIVHGGDEADDRLLILEILVRA